MNFTSGARIAGSIAAEMEIGKMNDRAHQPAIFSLGHQNTQGARADPIMERRFHPFHFAVARDEQTAVTCFDARLRHTERLEIPGLIDAAKERVQRQPEEAEPAGAVRKIETQPAGIETGRASRV